MDELPEDVKLHDRAFPGTRGNDTTDRVFCLSVNEAEWYFREHEPRICYATRFTECKGIGTCGWPTDEWWNEKHSWHWMLKTPGVSHKCAGARMPGVLSDSAECLSGRALIPSDRQETEWFGGLR